MSPSQDRYVCIHGHFYQPPRENPWLESVETQDSAAPFHDWNERITSECYAPNGASRVLNQQKKITRIVNNYARISNNFGPTLLSWLEENAPRAYRGILDADKLGMQRFGGHGPAMAQVYNHIIMPLANQRDKITQIRWGIADFVYRFGRQPEGMWLAETAVDRITLDLLAQHGIKFVILAPSQCKHIRPIVADTALQAETPWQPVTQATLDTRVAYRVPLEEGRSIAAFFYDGAISRAVAFEGLLSSGDKFASRLLGGFLEGHASPQLVHIATDGESYGHHHRHGEMALSYALELVEAEGARLTIYGALLRGRSPRQLLVELHPRRGTLALRLRLQQQHSRMEPAMAHSAAQFSGLAPRPDRRAVPGTGRQDSAARPGGRQLAMEGAQRLHLRHPRPLP
jgi:alpha-amylase/alpha-mannosidase (GH57 family)